MPSYDDNAPLCQQILNITVAEIESVIEPDGITDDIRWESVTLVNIHPEIILYRELTCQYLFLRLGNVQWSKTARITGILSTQEVNLSVPR